MIDTSWDDGIGTAVDMTATDEQETADWETGIWDAISGKEPDPEENEFYLQGYEFAKKGMATREQGIMKRLAIVQTIREEIGTEF